MPAAIPQARDSTRRPRNDYCVFDTFGLEDMEGNANTNTGNSSNTTMCLSTVSSGFETGSYRVPGYPCRNSGIGGVGIPTR
eukprot:3728756-Rhodomonas_salina.1